MKIQSRKQASSHRKSLRSFPKKVIVEWLEQRGISYFPEELEGVAERLKATDPTAQCRKPPETISREGEVL